MSFRARDEGSRHQDKGARGDIDKREMGKGLDNRDQPVDIYPRPGVQGYQVPHYIRSYPPYPCSQPYPYPYSYPHTLPYLYPHPYSQHFLGQTYPQTQHSSLSNTIKQEPTEYLTDLSSHTHFIKQKLLPATVTPKTCKQQNGSVSEQEKMPNHRVARKGFSEQREAEKSISIPKENLSSASITNFADAMLQTRKNTQQSHQRSVIVRNEPEIIRKSVAIKASTDTVEYKVPLMKKSPENSVNSTSNDQKTNTIQSNEVLISTPACNTPFFQDSFKIHWSERSACAGGQHLGGHYLRY